MVIWLRKPANAVCADRGVGIEGDVLRREALAELIELDAGFSALEDERSALLRDAGMQAGKIVDDARAEAQEILREAKDHVCREREEARRIYDNAAREGYEAGLKKAIEDWHARASDAADECHRMQQGMRERLAELVTSAVEQIVRAENTDALFKRALATVDRIMENASYLSVSVNPNDYDEASLIFSRLAEESREWGRSMKLTVLADKRLEPRSCLCESDLGIVDASLDTQIAAMRAAVGRVLTQNPNEGERENL